MEFVRFAHYHEGNVGLEARFSSVSVQCSDPLVRSLAEQRTSPDKAGLTRTARDCKCFQYHPQRRPSNRPSGRLHTDLLTRTTCLNCPLPHAEASFALQ